MCAHLVDVIILWWLEGSICSQNTHIVHLLQMCYHSSTHPSHSSICKEELKKMHNYRASRQQSGYELSPLSQPSVWCWVFCSDECFTRMCTSGMCLYNRLKHPSLRFKCYDYCLSILCWPQIYFWSIWPSLSPQTINRPSLTIWCNSSQVLISLPDTKSYSQVPQLLEWAFLEKNLLDSWAKVRSVKSLKDLPKFCLEMTARCPWSHLFFRLITKIYSLSYKLLMSTFLINIHCRILVVTLHRHVLLIFGNMQILK